VEDALRLAQDADLDLVEVAPDARPPVCKIMDYGKFKYEADMKAREARRNQTNTVLKEIRFRLKIDPHDYGTKKGHVERFLKAGDKVKVMIMFRGREQSRPEMGIRLLQRLATDVVELGFIESSPKQDGRNMIMVLGPVKKKADQKNEQRRAAQVDSGDDGDAPAWTPPLVPFSATLPPAPVAASPIVAETTPEVAAPAPAVATSAPAASTAVRPVAAPRPAAAPRPVTGSRPTSGARPTTSSRPASAPRTTSGPRPTTAPTSSSAAPRREPAPRPASASDATAVRPAVPSPAARPAPAAAVSAVPAAPAAAPKPVPRPGPAGPRPTAKPAPSSRPAAAAPPEEAKA